MKSVSVLTKSPIGKIKPMHGVGGGPRQGGAHLAYDLTPEFREIGIPFSRLHDIEYCHGSDHFVDVHCIFPDFNADETDPKSYHFTSTDKYLAAIVNAGTEVFYRLGESIEHFEKKLYVVPPNSFAKWARICEHIIMHYNEGWADGFHYGIRYWEIWNEPESDSGRSAMWTGTDREFFELYRITANHLKNRFPDLKIGGYGASGFYGISRTELSEWFKTLIPYAERFFTYITAPETKAPMDFFSWHSYCLTPEEMAVQANFAHNLLLRYGFRDCESILDEFNTRWSLDDQPSLDPGYASELAACLVTAQKTTIDALMYYDIQPGFMNGLFKVENSRKNRFTRYPAYYALYDFGQLYRAGTQVQTSPDEAGVLYTLAATDKSGVCRMMVVVRDYEGDLHLALDHAYAKATIHLTDGEHVFETLTENAPLPDVLKVKKNSILYIELQ